MSTKQLFITLCVALAVCLGVSSMYIEQSQAETALMLEVAIAEQSKTLTTLAELTAQNRADAVAESIVRDCSTENRARYEAFLNRLSRLTAAELIEAEQLFDACAGFFAERKSIMVSRLQREYEVYSSYIDLYAKLEPAAAGEYPDDVWAELVALESERGALLNEQVDIQRKIITMLQTTERDTQAIEVLLVRSQQVTQRATELNREINTVRESLYAV